MNEFDNRSAIVTGTTGIGKAIALRLARGGCEVVACGNDPAANSELARDAQALQLRVEQCDVSAPDQVEALVARTVAVLAIGYDPGRFTCPRMLNF